jgi:hypothetical protein
MRENLRVEIVRLVRFRQGVGGRKRGRVVLRKLLVSAVVFVMSTGMLVACGSSEEDSSAGQKEAAKAGETEKAKPIDAVHVAYKKTAAEQSARVEFTTVTSGIPTGATNPEGPESMEFRMNGKEVVCLAGQRSRMTMRMGPLGNFEFRMLDSVAYYKMPQDATAQMPGIKPWVKADLDSFYEQQYGQSFSGMQANNPTDPTQQLEALKDVGSVERIGQERIRGASTTHYRAVMDLKKAAAQEGSETKKAYDKMIEQMGTSKMPMDVWLDATAPGSMPASSRASRSVTLVPSINSITSNRSVVSSSTTSGTITSTRSSMAVRKSSMAAASRSKSSSSGSVQRR